MKAWRGKSKGRERDREIERKVERKWREGRERRQLGQQVE